jgi:hypothetical protein
MEAAGEVGKDEAAARGGDSIYFLGCAMCLWAPRSRGLVYCSSFLISNFVQKNT